MLSLNPKQRPTIVEILNKAFIRKRLTSYFSEIFSGNYPEANLPNDVDDVIIRLESIINKFFLGLY